jgi:hypothetical protein
MTSIEYRQSIFCTQKADSPLFLCVYIFYSGYGEDLIAADKPYILALNGLASGNSCGNHQVMVLGYYSKAN